MDSAKYRLRVMIRGVIKAFFRGMKHETFMRMQVACLYSRRFLQDMGFERYNLAMIKHDVISELVNNGDIDKNDVIDKRQELRWLLTF